MSTTGSPHLEAVCSVFAKQVSQDSVVIGTPAKVNLFLEVLGKRDDGYHDINSLFQAVSLFDRITFTRVKDGSGISIDLTNDAHVPIDESNLIARAFRLMRDRFGLTDGLQVQLEKNIPIAAGLAGGSADAAATILAVCGLWDLGLDFGQMAELGLEIGSDLPFFFTRGQAMVGGRGEKITETDFPTDYWIILATPDLHISTAESYAALRIDLTKTKIPFSFQRCKSLRRFIDALEPIGNDFEKVHLRSYPVLERIKDGLLGIGAQLTRMSGSGPTVFGLFDSVPETKSKRLFGKETGRVIVVRPVALPVRLP